jgi:myo-inositol-1(or 4)-monophosphatase
MDTLAVAQLAAEEAAKVIRDARHEVRQIRHKGAIDLVTQVDLAAEHAIRTVFEQHTPDIPILAEEGGGAETEATRWIVDPLDGTTNFVHGYPSYAVSIALQVEGVLEVGCVFDPVHWRSYTARRGGGAWLGDERLKVSSTEALSESLLVTGFPYDRRERVDWYLSFVREFLLRGRGLRRAGAAAMDFVAIATGVVDGYWEFGLNPWDVAAGVLLVQEAGGTVTNMEGGDIDIARPQLLATNGKVHAEMTEVLLDLLKSAQREY